MERMPLYSLIVCVAQQHSLPLLTLRKQTYGSRAWAIALQVCILVTLSDIAYLIAYFVAFLVLGTIDESQGQAEGIVLSVDHNGRDPSEVARILSEHPGEEEAIMRDRVLGAIAVTRGKSYRLHIQPTSQLVYLKTQIF